MAMNMKLLKLREPAKEIGPVSGGTSHQPKLKDRHCVLELEAPDIGFQRFHPQLAVHCFMNNVVILARVARELRVHIEPTLANASSLRRPQCCHGSPPALEQSASVKLMPRVL